jgi:beta-lactamase regulating signal transducer with metallopeptidase domain
MMTPSIVEIAVKSSLVMALAAVAAGLMRRRGSSASRHLVWTLAVVALLVLPIASAVLPSWNIPIRRQESAAPLPIAPQVTEGVTVPTTASSVALQGTAASGRTQSPTAIASISWIALLPMAYMAGVVLLLGRLAVEHWKTRRMLSRTTRLDDAAWNGLLDECTASLGVARAVRLVRSREEAMPMTCGVRRPVVVIPSIADLWDEDRRRAVLLHELAHVVRFDCLTQTLAEVAVALYWMHPGTWWMARRLRVERELACDDCVLSSGTEPREYAGHLLEIAHSLGGYRAPALAVSMARPQQLEGRMLALLDATRNRATPATSRRLFALVLTAVAVTPIAAATAVAVPGVAAASNAKASPGTTQVAPALRAFPQAQAGAATSVPAGTWQIRLASDGRSVHLAIGVGENSFHSTTFPLDRVEGLAAILTGPGGPAHYSLRREAGTFDFEGTVRSGVGGGTFSFTPSTTFTAELVKRGFGKPTLVEQGKLAWADIGFAFLDELEAQKYERPTLQQLVSGAEHGVTRTYVREMSAVGYRVGSIGALIRLRDHGVDAGFVRDMQALGFKGLTADDAVRARDHGIDAGYARGLRALGYSLSLEQLVDARNHGVDADYVGALRQLGYQLTLEELIAARNHGVDAAYVREMASAGYSHPSMTDLIRMRGHGISATTVQQLKSRGVDRPSIDRLIELHDRGANADPALMKFQLQASRSLLMSLHVVLRDANAAVRQWKNRWLN